MDYHIDAAGVYFVLMLGNSNKGSCLSEKKNLLASFSFTSWPK